MKRREPKWLLRKISGSRGRYTYKPDYSETRNEKKNDIGDLPQREGMGKGHSFLDTSLVKRWLNKQVGRDFDDIYSQFVKRIQPKYFDEYKDCIYDYVVKPEDVILNNQNKINSFSKPFFIHPQSNILKKYSDFELKKGKRKEIKNSLGKFYFQEETQIWETIGVFPSIRFKEDIENLTSERETKIKSYLNKIEKVKQKAIIEIDNFAEEYQIKNVTNGIKILLWIEFLYSKKTTNFNLCFDVAGNRERDWKVRFTDFTIESVEIIK